MDFIFKQIEENIQLYDDREEVKIYLQVRIEYSIILILAYLWNKNFQRLQDFTLQGKISRTIQSPTIGNLLYLIKQLDLDNEIFSDGSDLFDYLEIRNNLIGHGYSFNLQDYKQRFSLYFQSIVEQNIDIINANNDIILVEKYDPILNLYTGQNYNSQGNIKPWRCSKELFEFKLNNLYISSQPNSYFRISPFIHIEKPKRLYLFNEIGELLLGRVTYNRLDEDEAFVKFTKDWDELCNDFSANDGIKEKSPNNTIINKFENNYDKYIEVGSIKDKILKYLIGNKRESSVSITIWGHGGIGKTATVQKICDYLKSGMKFKKEEKFDYIIFLSAKDRRLNLITGKIDEIEATNRVSTYQSLVKRINGIIYNDETFNVQRIFEFKQRLLLIIDDYETFEQEDREQIKEFVENLSINHHKVIITTRNRFLSIGNEIQTNELNPQSTYEFLLEILNNNYAYTQENLDLVNKELLQNENIKLVHQITTGRPAFIFIFANYLAQRGSLVETLSDKNIKKISSSSDAINFLFGRVYKQLGEDQMSKDIFCIIGKLTPADKLTSLIKHVKYLLNIKEENIFVKSLDKLKDLKVIEYDENGFYQVYSSEIIEIMLNEFEKRDHGFRSGIIGRLNDIEKYKDKDTIEALLLNADNSRIAERPEQYVIDKYREIIRYPDAPKQIKIKALLNLTDYLARERRNVEAAIKIFDDFEAFKFEHQCVRMHAEYYWVINEKVKAIQVLSDYYLNFQKKGVSISTGVRIQMLSILVLRKSTYWLDNEDITAKEIILREYNNLFKNYGIVLFNLVQKHRIDYFTPGERQDVLTALSSLVDICSSIPSNQYSLKICIFVLESVQKIPNHIASVFNKKFNQLKLHGRTKHIQIPEQKNQESELNKEQKHVKEQPHALDEHSQTVKDKEIFRNTPKIELTVLGKIELPETAPKKFHKVKPIDIKDKYLGHTTVLKDTFGYIKSYELDKDVYFAKNTVNNTNFYHLYEQDIVEFSLERDIDGSLIQDRWGNYRANMVSLADKT